MKAAQPFAISLRPKEPSVTFTDRHAQDPKPQLTVDGQELIDYFSLEAARRAGRRRRLPFSLKVLLENLLFTSALRG